MKGRPVWTKRKSLSHDLAPFHALGWMDCSMGLGIDPITGFVTGR